MDAPRRPLPPPPNVVVHMAEDLFGLLDLNYGDLVLTAKAGKLSVVRINRTYTPDELPQVVANA
jgi:hypothetical protein